jgi:deazaflavin-dependent oxidoreductase (nitroreductase family)
MLSGMIPPRPMLRLLWATHRGINRLTGGRVGTVRPTGRRLGTLFVLSTGRTSGQPRRNPVYYVEEGPNLIVVASNAGAATDPAWWQNLQAQPDASVEIGGQQRPIRARVATLEEQARLWPRFVRGSANFGEYQANTERKLSVVILEPRVSDTIRP